MESLIDTLEGLVLTQDSTIKVMGVGGGGCNAVNYLYSQGVKDVTFLVCNTDKQSLEGSSVPAKLQLGPGLGAGGKPEVAQEYAEQNRDRIKEALNDGNIYQHIKIQMKGRSSVSVVSEDTRLKIFVRSEECAEVIMNLIGTKNPFAKLKYKSSKSQMIQLSDLKKYQ